MSFRRTAWTIAALALVAVACSTSSVGTCCDVGSGQGVPSCICGATHDGDGGTCTVASIVGDTCTISCGGSSAGGSTTDSCSD